MKTRHKIIAGIIGLSSLLPMGNALANPQTEYNWIEVDLKYPANIDSLELEANTTPLKVRIGDGKFVRNSTLPINRPLWIEGNGKSTEISGQLVVYDDLIASGIQFGYDGNPQFSGVGSNHYTEIFNCSFIGDSALLVDSNGEVKIYDNLFANSSHTNFYSWMLGVTDVFSESEGETKYPVEIRDNTFKNCNIGIATYLEADLGTTETSGNNSFIDCEQAIVNEYNGTIWAMDNYFETTEPSTKGRKSLEKRVLTDEQEIRDEQIGGTYDYLVEVSGLPYNPNLQYWNGPDVPVDSTISTFALGSALALAGYFGLKRKSKTNKE